MASTSNGNSNPTTTSSCSVSSSAQHLLAPSQTINGNTRSQIAEGGSNSSNSNNNNNKMKKTDTGSSSSNNTADQNAGRRSQQQQQSNEVGGEGAPTPKTPNRQRQRQNKKNSQKQRNQERKGGVVVVESSQGKDEANNGTNGATRDEQQPSHGPTPSSSANPRTIKRNRNRNKKKNNNNNNNNQNENGTGDAGVVDSDDNGGTDGPKSQQQQQTTQGYKPINQPANRKDGKGKNDKNNNNVNQKNENQNAADGNSDNNNTICKKKNNKNNKQRQRKRYPWRKHIPQGTVDPITLENLQSLPYPPFALVAAEPYDPVDEWPIPDESEMQSRINVEMPEETDAEREQRILQEQWGTKLPIGNTSSSGEDSKPPPASAAKATAQPTKRHYHLYDGRALAYYMVSQLQFIDPLNRRDLTRDELNCLDRYLRRHGFQNLNVTEAYDAKGITLSTAGATANTAAGRAAILQQEASVLLGALFGGGVVSTMPSTTSRSTTQQNDLRSQYRAAQQQQRQQQQSLAATAGASSATPSRSINDPYSEYDIGIYGGSGVMVIDDDMNPGLRGSAPEFIPGGGDSTLWSASHIRAAHHQGHAAAVQAHEFPTLEAAVGPAPAASAAGASANVGSTPQPSSKKPPPPPSKSLSKIASAVKKTDPDELQRQWEAREEARRRAMMSAMTFGSNMAAWDTPTTPQIQTQEIPSSITTFKDGPTEGQLQRNKAFADALGIAPATKRVEAGAINTGWARPVDHTSELDEFGNELNLAIYPDSLIVQARERMAQLLKLEKKWRAFLSDDTSASLPLNPMDRPMRAFVHEYAAFWKLHTESFDREPKRYIHCVKLRDTSAPYPLLSDAARNWRGPRPILASTAAAVASVSDHSVQQTAGQTTLGREIPAAPQRQPLSLKPRTTNLDSVAGIVATGSGSGGSAAITIGGAPTRTMTDPVPTNSRLEGLSSARERPKLQLQKRSIPLEVPAYEAPELKPGFDITEDMQRREERMREKARKEQEEMRRQQRALEAAFASDSEDDSDGSVGVAGDDDSWVEQEALVTGDDE